MSEDFERHLEAALRTRPVIEQAKGILGGYRRQSPQKAFDELVRASQQHNVRLVELAAAVVAVVAGEDVDDRARRVISLEWAVLTESHAAPGWTRAG
jgi:hypothetical protein